MSRLVSKVKKEEAQPVEANLSSTGTTVPGLPVDDEVLSKTEIDQPHLNTVGSKTERLSDITDEHDEETTLKHSKQLLSVWYEQVQPLIRNRRVRCFSFANVVLSLINCCLFIAFIVMTTFMIVLLGDVYRYKSRDMPCLYEWTKWSSCSKECREFNDTSPPLRYRKVKPETLVRARGKYETTAPCPPNILELVDYAPCNTHLCARKLSSFGFSRLFRVNASNNDKCYRIRLIPRADMLITLDVADLYFTAPCSASVEQAKM